MKKRLSVIFILLFIGICGLLFIKNRKLSSSEEEGYEIVETVSKISNVQNEEKKDTIVVHICGEVVSEGVYELNENSRVVDAINIAGGLTKKAAKNIINQAELLKDGMRIYIPSKNEIKNQVAGNKVSELININTATREELMSLNGVGASRADLIISFREENGSFTKIEDLMKIKGIKQRFFEKIKDKICT